MNDVDVIGEARSTLANGASSDTWTALVDIVDGCPDDDLSKLVDFLAPQLDRWPEPDAEDELRVAPAHWIEELSAGGGPSKCTLARAIHAKGTTLDGALLARALNRDAFEHLRHIDLDENKTSRALWNALRTAPSTRTLEYLRFSRLRKRDAPGIQGAHHLGALRTLCYRNNDAIDWDALGDFVAADAFANVESVHIQHDRSECMLAQLTNKSVIPNLKTLRLRGFSEDLKLALGRAAVTRVERVELEFPSWTEFTQALTEATRSARLLRHLDLSHVGKAHGCHPDQPHHAREFAQALGRWKPPRYLKTLSLGRWYTSRLARDVSRQHGIEVVR